MYLYWQTFTGIWVIQPDAKTYYFPNDFSWEDDKKDVYEKMNITLT
jgi:hypothetical protein